MYQSFNTSGGGSGENVIPPQFGEGGTIYADRPTTVIFGEKGPEIAEFTPVSKMGKSESKTTGGAISSSTANGRVSVRVDLSPDLIGRIEENTLNQAAEVLLEVQRRY
jgi:hypothetical protein